MLAQLLTIVAPTFLCALVGLAYGRFGPGLDARATTALITRIGAPCLVFSSLVSLDVRADAMLRIALGAAASLLLVFAVGWIGLRLARLPRHTYLAPLMFSNAGNMGLPICLFAFGSEGLSLAVSYFVVAAVTQYTVGVSIWAGRVELRELVRTPLVLSAVIAVLVLWLSIPVPVWIVDTTELLGGITIPLMLLNLGESIGRMRVVHVSRSLALAAARLALGSAVGLGLAHALGLHGAERGVLILQCAMPAAVFNYVLAQEYERSPEEIAGIVVLSTLLAFPLLPVLLAFLI